MSHGGRITAIPDVADRLIGEIDHGIDGPTFLVLGGMHGNEPAGVEAAQRVLDELALREIQIQGRIVACRGNVAALASGKRFHDRDLNRRWYAESVEELLQRSTVEDSIEDEQQRGLLSLFGACYQARKGPIVFLDLHTSSAEGAPFSCLADTLPNRRIADALPVPMILGLEECIDGAVLEWFNGRGQIGIAFEGGQHEAASSIDNLESAVWLALAASGVIRTQDADVLHHRQRLESAARGAPHRIEIRYRHVITPEDGFVMKQGFKSFDRIERGQHMGDGPEGPIHAHESGLVLLPLYQGQGEDGFFLARRIPGFWFNLSAIIRRSGLSAALALLPGVRRDPADPDTLLVNRKIARFLAVQVFHLFGYRKLRSRDKHLAFSRRTAAREAFRAVPR